MNVGMWGWGDGGCRSVAADLRRMVASIAVKVGGREEYEAVKKLYKEADMPDFKQDCLLGKRILPSRTSATLCHSECDAKELEWGSSTSVTYSLCLFVIKCFEILRF